MSLTNYLASRTIQFVYRNVGRVVQPILTFRRLIFVFGSVYAGGVLFQHHLYTWSLNQGSSMYPTIATEGSITIVKKLSKKQIAQSVPAAGIDEERRNLRVGDVIRFTSPLFQDQFAGKRIVGMPGDYVVKDPNMAPTVGNAPMQGITDWRSDEEIARGVELKDVREEPEMVQVPEGHIWVSGDNLSWSRDSRLYGPVPMALVDGKTIHVRDGLFTGQSLSGAMRKIPKEEEEWVLNGRAARVVAVEHDLRRSSTPFNSSDEKAS